MIIYDFVRILGRHCHRYRWLAIPLGVGLGNCAPHKPPQHEDKWWERDEAKGENENAELPKEGEPEFLVPELTAPPVSIPSAPQACVFGPGDMRKITEPKPPFADHCPDGSPAKVISPTLLTRMAILKTREALDDKVQGTGVASCMVDEKGLPRDCCLTQQLKYMNTVLLNALRAQRYQPATQCGRPITVRIKHIVKLV